MNKIMPQRTFSPRSFMGDRGISLDGFGRVLKNEFFDDYDENKTIVAPKPWKPSHSKTLSNSKFVDENLFEEAGLEIQTIILHTLNMFEDNIGTATSLTTESPSLTQQQQQPQAPPSQQTNNNPIKPLPKSINANNFNNNNFQNIFGSSSPSKKNNDNIATNNNNNIVNNNNCNITDINSLNDSFSSISQTIGNLIENYTQEPLIELKIPFFSHSPCFSADPVPLTPPTRTHNPITMNQAFTTDGADPQQGAEIGLLSISPPPLQHYKF